MDSHQGLAVLRAFANFDINIQFSTVWVFMHIAHKGECIQRDLEEHLGLSNASASRNVSYWTDDIQRSTGLPGPGLIERRENPRDRRYKILKLTPKGEEFYKALRESTNGTLKDFDRRFKMAGGRENKRHQSPSPV